jgi:hypothetical protein
VYVDVGYKEVLGSIVIVAQDVVPVVEKQKLDSCAIFEEILTEFD